MSYEEEQRRLHELMEEYLTSDDECNDDTDKEEDDVLEERTDDSDSEQDAESSNDESMSLGPHFIGKNKTSKWRKHMLSKNERTRMVNIVTQRPGVRLEAKNAKSPLECWELFFTGTIISTIVECTNKHIRKVSENYTRERSARPTDCIEIKALLGLLYLAGCMKNSRLNTKDLWDRHGLGIEIFWLTMSKERFIFLLRCLTFDDLDTREERRSADKLAPIRSIFDLFVEQCKNNFTISANATVDGMLLAFRGRCAFKQYIPNKPSKYGIKVFSLADSLLFYTSNMEVYVGQQPEGPFKLANDPACIVERLIIPISGTGRNITADNWFTSFPLVSKLLNDHKLTYVGTVRKNKTELPPEFVNTKNRPVASSMFSFQDKITLISYVPKRNRNVILTSSMHYDNSIDRSTGEKMKPEIITYYNSTKGGVDTVAQLCENYNVARNTRCWPMVIFYSMMNIAGINSQVIHTSNNESRDHLVRRKFLRNIGLTLVDEHVKRHSTATNVPRDVKKRRMEFAGTSTEDVPRPVIQEGTRKKCVDCKKDRKTRYYCKNCSKFLCLEHAQIVCINCFDRHISN